MKLNKKNSKDFEKIFLAEFNSKDMSFEKDKYIRLYHTLCFCKGYFDSDNSDISKVLNTIFESIKYI